MAEPAGQQSTTSLSCRVRVCRAIWKVLLFVWVTLVLGILINVGSSWLITKNFDLSGTPLGWGVDHLWMILLLIFLLAMLTLLSWLGSHEKPPELLHPLSQQNRDHMLKRLQLRYGQMLAQSLQGAVQMELGLAKKPAAVRNAASLALRLPDQSEQLLDLQTSIVQAYELAQQELLILGEPGAGKSTQLLVLAKHLVEQAEQNAVQPLPVVLPLSSWATKQPPLHDWLVEQVALLYEVSKRVSKQWLQGEQLLPLLDGLDEIEEASMRIACITAINTYHREHLQSLVVCCRNDAYEAAATRERLALHTAVVVQPLSSELVNAYLEEIGRPVADLCAALKKDAVLAELVTTPLMLQVLILTYQGTKIRKLSQNKAQLWQKIWADYVERLVSHKGDMKHYPLDITRARLSWLAQEMRAHNWTIFLPEQMGLDWLPKGQRTFYRWSMALILGLGGALVGGLARGLGGALLSGLVFGLIFGLVGWLVFDLIGSLGRVRAGGLVHWLVGRLLVGLGGALIAGLIFGLVGALLSGLASWRTSGLGVGLAFWLVFGLIFGLLSLPSAQGKGRAGRLLVGLLAGLFVGLLVGLVGGLISGLVGWRASGLDVELVFGLGGGLLSGLGSIVRQFILRFWLWQARCTPAPWRYANFLNDATTRILLQRVGEGYQFSHRLLLDYFADLDAQASPTSTPVPSTPSPAP